MVTKYEKYTLQNKYTIDAFKWDTQDSLHIAYPPPFELSSFPRPSVWQLWQNI